MSLVSLLSHQRIPSFSTLQNMSNGVSITYETSSEMAKICIIFGEKYLEIHVHVPFKHPQQHSCHLPKSNLCQDESLFNSEHFIKKAHPHQTTSSKVTSFWAKKCFFFHRVEYVPSIGVTLHRA
jgi:hypothetical protein